MAHHRVRPDILIRPDGGIELARHVSRPAATGSYAASLPRTDPASRGLATPSRDRRRRPRFPDRLVRGWFVDLEE